MTHRQAKAFEWWTRFQLNVPDRHDHYVMQLTNVVLNVMAKNPKQHDLTIQFRWPTPEEIEATRQAQLKLDQSKALAFVEVGGKTAEKRTRTRAEARAMGLLLDDPKKGG